jgi:hypothetical protein
LGGTVDLNGPQAGYNAILPSRPVVGFDAELSARHDSFRSAFAAQVVPVLLLIATGLRQLIKAPPSRRALKRS